MSHLSTQKRKGIVGVPLTGLLKEARILLAIALLTGLLVSYPVATTCFADDSFDDEVAAFTSKMDHGEMGRDMERMHFVRGGRYLLSRMQEQQSAFEKKGGKGSNEVATRSEELSNEANLLASQGEYKRGMELLIAAHKLVVDSLNEMNGN